jgi:hypothetical protein
MPSWEISAAGGGEAMAAPEGVCARRPINIHPHLRVMGDSEPCSRAMSGMVGRYAG